MYMYNIVHVHVIVGVHAAVLEVIPVLKGVVADFERTAATSHLRRAALLLVGICVQWVFIINCSLSSTGNGV